MATTKKTVRVSEEELTLLKELRKGKVQTAAPSSDKAKHEAQSELANALADAIRATQPKPKKSIEEVMKQNPWYPTDGSPRSKKKRAFYHHGILIAENVFNEEIDRLNKIKPGNYCEGFVKVVLRKDRGIDIDYPIKTASQRLRLVNSFGIRSFRELLDRLIDEQANPTKYRRSEDMDLYE